MKCFRTTKEFANAVCQEKGQIRPKETRYLVDHNRRGLMMLRNAPKSYANVTQVVFCVDGERYAVKKFGVWVENPRPDDLAWLKQRRLREALDQLRRDVHDGLVWAPWGIEEEVQKELNRYLDSARQSCYDKDFNTRVLGKTLELMERDGRFLRLNFHGDPLNQNPA